MRVEKELTTSKDDVYGYYQMDLALLDILAC